MYYKIESHIKFGVIQLRAQSSIHRPLFYPLHVLSTIPNALVYPGLVDRELILTWPVCVCMCVCPPVGSGAAHAAGVAAVPLPRHQGERPAPASFARVLCSLPRRQSVGLSVCCALHVFCSAHLHPPPRLVCFTHSWAAVPALGPGGVL